MFISQLILVIGTENSIHPSAGGTHLPGSGSHSQSHFPNGSHLETPLTVLQTVPGGQSMFEWHSRHSTTSSIGGANDSDSLASSFPTNGRARIFDL